MSGRDVMVSPPVMQRILACDWPGNVRELQNAIERAAVLAADKTIEARHLPPALLGEKDAIRENQPTMDGEKPLDEKLAALEKGMIIDALSRSGGVQAQAARLLGVNERSLWHRIKKYRIDAASLKKLQNL
jgi:DNA-binding NtrC family response regulator